MKSKLLIISTIVLFIVSAFLIYTNINRDKEKLIAVLENYSFECTNNKCIQIGDENEHGCNLTGTVDFSKYQFTNSMYCSLTDITITTTYNWKAESLIQYFDMQSDSNMAVLDENGEFSCNAGTTEDCYNMKTTMLQHKNTFQSFISEADVDIDDLN